MSNEILYDPYSGQPCYLADPFNDPVAGDMFASSDIGLGLCAGSGTSFWLPIAPYGYVNPSPIRYVTRLYQTGGIAPASQSEADHRAASVAWVQGLATPISGSSAADPYSFEAADAECYFRDWTNPNVYPWYEVLLTRTKWARALWASRSCVGCGISSLRVEATAVSGTQPLDSTHKLRLVPVWLDSFADADERADLPWHPTALDAMDGIEIGSYGTHTLDVTAFGLSQQSGQFLGLICYYPFLMPDHWYLTGDNHRFAAEVWILNYELTLP